MFGLAGAWLAWPGLVGFVVVCLAFAAVVALLGRGRQVWAGRIPGGACAAFALWLVWLYGPLVIG